MWSKKQGVHHGKVAKGSLRDEKGSHWIAVRQQAQKATWPDQSRGQKRAARKIGNQVCTSGELTDLVEHVKKLQ